MPIFRNGVTFLISIYGIGVMPSNVAAFNICAQISQFIAGGNDGWATGRLYTFTKL